MTELNMAVIGECMLEISAGREFPNKSANFSFGGDTLNTALYCSRLGGKADYISALGDDIFSDSMIKIWQKEGIGTKLVQIVKGALPGLYSIANDSNGERTFLYWRDNAPVRQLFKSDYSSSLKEKIISNYDILYLSGITLSLFDDESIKELHNLIDAFRKHGGKFAFELNFRARGWKSIAKAREVIGEFMPKIDIATTGIDDEKILWDDKSALEIAERYKSNGCKEIVVKCGIAPTLYFDGESVKFVSLEEIVKPIDTTAAGDSFNGAYMAARLKGFPMEEAIIYGQCCAGEVIQHQGAIIPKGTTDKILENIQKRIKK